MAEAEPTPPYTDEQLESDSVSKKDIIQCLQELASTKFLLDNKLKGNVKNVTKTKTKEQLIESYKELFASKAFKKEGEEEEKSAGDSKEQKLVEKTKKLSVKEEEKEAPKYTKRVMKSGNRTNYPRKGDVVSCFYTGKLPDGTVFDQNAISTGKEVTDFDSKYPEEAKKYKKAQPLKFKVGVGNVIKGWDEGLLTMSVGEKAEFTIQPEWAYGKKGVEGKVPPNSTLIFEVELVTID